MTSINREEIWQLVEIIKNRLQTMSNVTPKLFDKIDNVKIFEYEESYVDFTNGKKLTTPLEIEQDIILQETLNYLATSASFVDIYQVNSQEEHLNLIVKKGDICIRLDLNKTYIALNNINENIYTDWAEILSQYSTASALIPHASTHEHGGTDLVKLYELYKSNLSSVALRSDINGNIIINSLVINPSSKATFPSIGNIIIDVDNSNKLSWYDGTSWNVVGGSGSITGSGTIGYLPKWSTTSILTDSLISESGSAITVAASITSNLLGINSLSVNSTGFTSSILYSTATAGGIGTFNAYPFSIITNNTSRIFIKSSGEIGIGFTSPLSKLCINGGVHVGGESDAGDNNLLVDGTITGSFAAYGSAATVFLTSVGGVIQSRTAAQVLSDIGASSSAHGVTQYYFPYAATSSTWGTSLIYTDGVGIGIGTTSIGGALLKLSQLGSGSGSSMAFSNNLLHSGGAGTATGAYFSSTGGNIGYALYISSGSSTSSAFGIYSLTSGSLGNNYAAYLNANGSAPTNYGLWVSAQNATTNYAIYSSLGLHYFGGNVGIGVTPDATASLKLNSIPAYGSAATVFLTSVGGIIESRTAAQVLSDIGAGTGSVGGSGTANYVPLFSASATLSNSVIQQTNSSPSGLIGINGAATRGIFEIRFGQNSNTAISTISNTTDGTLATASYRTGFGATGLAWYGDFGTTSDSFTTSGLLMRSCVFLSSYSDATNGLRVFTNGANPLILGTNNTNRVQILGTGEVGIGFSSPLSSLCVNGGVHIGGESAVGDNNLLVDGTATISTISAYGDPATVFLTHVTGLIESRTAAQVLSDIGALAVGGIAADSDKLDGQHGSYYAVAGAVGSSALTMNTARLLGRTTASAGAIEEITVSTGLSLSSTTLTCSITQYTDALARTACFNSLTTNYVTKYNGTNLAISQIIDDGTDVFISKSLHIGATSGAAGDNNLLVDGSIGIGALSTAISLTGANNEILFSNGLVVTSSVVNPGAFFKTSDWNGSGSGSAFWVNVNGLSGTTCTTLMQAYGGSGYNDIVSQTLGGNFCIGANNPGSAKLQILDTSAQLKLSYSNTKTATFLVTSTPQLEISGINDVKLLGAPSTTTNLYLGDTNAWRWQFNNDGGSNNLTISSYNGGSVKTGITIASSTGNVSIANKLDCGSLLTGTFTGTLSPRDASPGSDLHQVTCTWSKIGDIVTLTIPLCYTKDTTYATRYLTGIPTDIRPTTAKNVAVWIFGSDAGYDTKRWISNIYVSNSANFAIAMKMGDQTDYNWDYYGLENQVITYSLL